MMNIYEHTSYSPGSTNEPTEKPATRRTSPTPDAPKGPGRFRRFLRGTALVLAGALGAGALLWGAVIRGAKPQEPSGAPDPHAPAVLAAAERDADDASSDASDTLDTAHTTIPDTVENIVARKALDSIVGITVNFEQRSRWANGFGFGFGPDMPRYVEGVGSGVILSKDGLIITNSHVVNGGQSDSLVVTLSDGKEIDGAVVWADEALDLALVRIDAENLSPITLADSSTLEVGDKVIAIGNPLGLDLQSTLTSGYVSGLDRTLTVENGQTMENLIQTDAAINAGNSGGALLNAAGELVAINTAKAGGADGIGFAIPINVALPVIHEVMATGHYEQVALGIRGIASGDYQLMRRRQGEQVPALAEGVYISEVSPNSAADDAGLKAGDVITALNGTAITSMNQLKTELVTFSLGDTVTVTIHRDGESRDLTLTFKDTLAPEEPAATPEAPTTPETPDEPKTPDDTETPDTSEAPNSHDEGLSPDGMTDEDREAWRHFMEHFFDFFEERNAG